MLERVCLSQPDVATGSTIDHGLGDCVRQNCANLCVENAQKMINLVYEYHKPVGAVAIIPWWFRIFYLHIAATVLIAAKLRVNLFTPMVSESWNRAMTTLQAHEYLSPYVLQCLIMFQTLSGKIMETHHSGSSQSATRDVHSSTYFQDIFHDMGFEPETFLFGKEDISWLSNFEAPQ